MTNEEIKKKLQNALLSTSEPTQEDLKDSNGGRPLGQSSLYLNSATSEWVLRTQIEQIIEMIKTT